MPEFTSYPPGSPCWVDLMSPDTKASAAFYSRLFGWDVEELFDDEGNAIYNQFRLNGKIVAGMGGQPPGMEGMPAIWNTYIAVADCDETAEAVAAAGGAVFMAPMQVMDAGQMAVFADTTGAVFSVWQAGGHFGSEICNETNTWSWNELMTADVEAAKSFYSAVFGWTYADQDMGDAGIYTVIEGGDNDGLGGIMARVPDLGDEIPDNWSVYFFVEDADAVVAMAGELGGQTLVPPFPIPGVGRTAVLMDPQGGTLCLLEPDMSGDQ